MNRSNYAPTQKNGKSDTKSQTPEEMLKSRMDSVSYYQNFIKEKLQVDLDRSIQNKAKILEDLESYLDLKSNIELIQENQLKEMKTMINLGCECYVKAKVPDTTMINVNVGLDIYVQYSLDDALKFIETREIYLSKQAEQLTTIIYMIQTKIDLILQSINDLISLPK
ncbi:prefoldin alpha subunit family protein [Tieghemostelium lacteum]|uniref:Prefoldin alpha subunit family protein n=1 Tax=Tieghemostelium lacteum TaxID=361077 RepID=A0A152A4I3_TIELA|nr:prefoldin alpha subunit family protein [Tieghemostelium lacteum]|eukprot:KYR01139.1 prefoldin alpha subunit family protein [Tieghemostelium lacteum]